MMDNLTLKNVLKIAAIDLGICLIFGGVIAWMIISAANPDTTQIRLMIDNWPAYLLIVAVMFCGTKLLRYRGDE